MMRLAPGLVRIPDVSFVSWDRFPDRRVTREPVPAIAPDLAVEVLSESNTKAEMDRKLREYFAAGARLVWYLDPEDRTVRVYTAVGRMTCWTSRGRSTAATSCPASPCRSASGSPGRRGRPRARE